MEQNPTQILIHKQCRMCGFDKPLDDFGIKKTFKDGRNIYCKACWKDYCRQYSLFKAFGITQDEYESMLTAQGGVCAICKRPPKTYALSVDHDHDTGKIRGILCVQCNVNIEWLVYNAKQVNNYLGDICLT